MNYFAYGSNMSLARLRHRISTVELLGTGRLVGHQLRFHKQGMDGSGKCDAFHTGHGDHAVHGVLFRIDAAGKAALDRFEGLGAGYEEKQVSVSLGTTRVEAVTYFATLIGTALKPFDWYLEHVLVGAREAQLPAAYLARLERVDVQIDPDRERYAREVGIHR